MKISERFILLGAVLITLLLVIGLARLDGERRQAADLAAVPETLIPAGAEGSEADYAPNRSVTFDPAPAHMPEPYSLRWRVGIGIPDGRPTMFDWPEHRPGWFLNWTVGHREDGRFQMDARPDLGMEFTPMVRMLRDRLTPSARELRILAARYPGRIWLISNEPDVRWQDNVTPQRYVEMYHEAHTAITSVDPTAQIAIGGVSQITPLRLAYLDAIWQGYREVYGVEMPVDVWNMHAFVLPESATDWGVGIPPGFDHVAQGESWGVEDHDDLALVEEQVRLMRAWMARHGQQNKPLYITEYGILMPAAYGFDQSRVIDFLVGSYDLFNTLRDEATGFPEDDYRLVQRWVWFSTRYSLYTAGDLFDWEGRQMALARAINGYLRTFGEE